MNSAAFFLLANSSPEVDENKKMELTFGNLSFYVGPSGSTCLSDPAKSGPSTSKTEIIAKSGSSVGSSSEANSLVSLAATENLQEKFEEPNKTGESSSWKQQWTSHATSQGTSPAEAVASPEAYTSYASSSLKQQKKKIITRATRRSTCKSTN
jgi:hypothetical protein